MVGADSLALAGARGRRWLPDRPDTMLEATPAELTRTFGWPADQARTALDDLVAARLAVRSPGGYRPAPP